ncbi:MAG: zinc-dependent metalloprotease [Phycisphaerales bacterium JB043]
MPRLLILFALTLLVCGAHAQDTPVDSEEATKELVSHEGLRRVLIDEDKGRVLLELTPGDDGGYGSFILVDSLATGLGSNPVGLDRGQLRSERIVEFRRTGERVLMIEPNLRFRAQTGNPDERRAVEQSFAPSVIWAGKIEEARDGGVVVVDVSSYLTGDATGVIGQLRATGQGTFRVDAGRSAVLTEATLVFPDNIELEALVTYTSDRPGRLVRQTSASGDALTLTHHVSLIRLPDDGYEARAYDPRMGAFATSFLDYASDLDEPMVVQLANRHRLGEGETLVYYVDAGAPEPIRSALVEGASWWAEAFEASGFPNGFRVEILPDGAHPLDVRYNVIQWVHRSTRGWSYGGSITDPRTGEILKGHVSLGSLRIRQDILLFEGLLGTSRTGTGDADDPIELALARIRQLSAHEVGHTLGFAHNFAASTYAGRASVMDYPAPLIRLNDDGTFDCSDAYGVGIGAWDILATRHLYTRFDEGVSEDAALEAIVREGVDSGYLYISDQHARSLGSMHPKAHLWDNGESAIEALRNTLAVRARAIETFDATRLAQGRRRSQLHEVFVPVYLHHRYQLEAASKLIGGVDFSYTLNGGDGGALTPVDGATQREALELILSTLSADSLAIPDRVLALMTPREPGSWPSDERFGGTTGDLFDPIAVGKSLIGFTLDALLHRQRLARVHEQHRRDETQLSIEELISGLRVTSGLDSDETPDPVRNAMQQQIIERLIVIWRDQDLALPIRAASRAAALEARQGLASRGDDEGLLLSDRIVRELQRSLPSVELETRVRDLPPGSPIGMGFDIHGCSQDRHWLEATR